MSARSTGSRLVRLGELLAILRRPAARCLLDVGRHPCVSVARSRADPSRLFASCQAGSLRRQLGDNRPHPLRRKNDVAAVSSHLALVFMAQPRTNSEFYQE